MKTTNKLRTLLAGCAIFATPFAGAVVVYDAGQWDPNEFTPLSQANNAFYGVTPIHAAGEFVNGKNGANLKDNGNGTYTYYESQQGAENLTDGLAPDMPYNYYTVEGRRLIENFATLTFELGSYTNIKGFNFYTQWDNDGFRNDVSIQTIEYSADGQNWTVVNGSNFNFSKTESRNTVGSYISNCKRRYVKMYDGNGNALAVNAKYVRIAFGVQDVGYGAYWEIEAEKGGNVESGVYASAVASSASATVTGYVATGLSGTARVKFGRNPLDLHRSVAVDLVQSGNVMNFSVELPDLVSSSTYTYAVEYLVGNEVVLAQTNDIFTAVENGLELPGLWQARLSGNLNVTDGLSASDIGVARALGPIMGFDMVKDYTTLIYNEVDGNDYAWADNKTYLYQGFIFLQAGVSYEFWTCQDDDGRIAIDGTEVVRSTGCLSDLKAYETDVTGWHAIDVRVGNGAGWAGANDGGIGVGYALPGGPRQRLKDPGDGSFLCCTLDHAVPGSFKVVSVLNDNGECSVILEGQFGQEVSVRALCGTERHGTDPQTWDSVVSVGAMQGGGASSGIFTFAMPSGTKYVRFAAYESDNLVSLTSTIPVVEMSEPSLAPTLDNVKVSSVDAASATFDFDVISEGAAANWSVKALYGFSVGSLQYEQDLGSDTGKKPFSGALSGLLPGHRYFVKLVVDNGVDAASTEVFDITTETFSEPEAGARAISLGTASVSDSGVAGALELAAAEAASDIYMVYGAVYGGDSRTDWTASVSLGSAAASATSFELSAALPSGSIGTAVKYVRFCAVTGGATSWTAPIALGNGDFPVFAGVTGIGSLALGDTISISSSLPYAASSCAVTVEVSRSGDFADAVSYSCGSVAPGGTIEKTLHSEDKTSPEYINPGETVYIRLKAVDSGNAVGYSGVEKVRPYGAPVIGYITHSWSLWDLSVTGSLDEYGASTNGGCTVELWIAKKGGELEKVAEKPVAENSGFTFDYEVPEFGEYIYVVRVKSECATESFDTGSVQYTVNVVDNSRYYWKVDVAEGDWGNPDNWDCDKTSSSGRKTVPNSPYCEARFDNRGTGPTVVTLDGKYDIYQLKLANVANVKLTLAGKGVPGTDHELHVTDGDYGLRFPEGADFTLSNAYVRSDGKMLPNRNSKTRVLYGSTLDLNTEFWWRNDDNSYDADLEIRGRSTLYLRNYSLRCQGGNGTVILDDSTIYCGEGTNPHGVQIEYVKTGTAGIQFIVMGEQPQFLVNYVRLDHTNCGGFTFVIPEGGFKAPVFSQYPRTQGSEFNPYMDDNACIPFAVSQDSPALKSKVKCTLIDWPGTVSPDMLDLSLPEKYETRASFRWTYGENDAATGEVPTGLWLDCKGGGTVVKIR